MKVGCFTCESDSLTEWVKSGGKITILEHDFYLDFIITDITAFLTNHCGLEPINNERTRLTIIKNLRGHYKCAHLKSSLSVFLKRSRVKLSRAVDCEYNSRDIHADAWRFALSVEPLLDPVEVEVS